MSKKKIITISVILLILTNIVTFGLTNILSLQFNNKVIVPKKEYAEISSVLEEYSKILLLESIIEEDYLRDVDQDKFIEGQFKGVVQSLEDPYSQYLTEKEYKSLSEETSGSFGGIGVIVTPGDDNLITVVSPIEDTPGERAGIRSGDKIIKVDGEEYSAEEMDEAVEVMKGEPNTDVSLTIMRRDNNVNEMIDMDITREKIRLETVKSNIIDDNIGYIKLTSFDELTYDDFKKALEELENSNVEGLLIDLRNNPGGLLDSTADIANELLDKGDIVYTEDKNGKREYLKSDESHTELPLVVLVNEGSASASEILAGAIQDHNRGEIIGTTTFGKGVVQRIKPLSDGSAIKLTISEYFTPNGTSIHGIGVKPDIEVELNEDVEVIGVENLNEDNQLKEAMDVLKEKIK
ncbi:MAG TPA: S41 family peptidase [Tissierellaceae bacterium]|nr:S41 family peptidase [Tissierellaceae bacterium]